MFEKDPLKVPVKGKIAIRDVIAEEAKDGVKEGLEGVKNVALTALTESKEEDVTNLDNNDPQNDPNPPIRFTYLTPPPSEGYMVYHTVKPRPVKFNVSKIFMVKIRLVRTKEKIHYNYYCH